ncbi:hypothetical protein Kpol_2002p57 [Vanderwaltozyma polyspora DSM 70294]|uniref:Alpha-1,2-mannosyltransferase MNN5 n=1 Tax=Vanderwaltozyma polyspora (strain ATCC 22028 / DSM 70294 / BCRC 21397 / CBS 2163 / NBRC 10782 / NRRL Y-8283 / UCD 57-17) TaxID=436907 RepID=A7TFH2_VANPO|nr:uncharacterized protein Kpol_2002p57 [Vanderwaltozyma polyspora DSM 70294]EDO18986.1 hypothetical protein Kpol_2002p57 [Vanderwaltozyma polyspora DSM 70294]
MVRITIPANVRSLFAGGKLNKKSGIIAAVFTCCIFALILLPSGNASSPNGGLKYPPPGTNGVGRQNGYIPNHTIKNSKDFYYKLFDALAASKPVRPPKDANFRDEDKCNLKDIASYSSKEDHLLTSYESLSNCYNLTQSQYDDLHNSHELFTEHVEKSFQLSNSAAKSMWPNDKGIVAIGGGKFSVYILSMIKTLRAKGTHLPVEILMPLASPEDKEFCDKFLPPLNAKCVYFKDVLPKEFTGKYPIKISRFQYKVFSILFSSFRNVMYIDSDNLALKSLDKVFDTVAYRENGLILWPDIWRRVTAPIYYSVAGVPYNLEKRVRNMVDDLSPVSRYDNVENPGNDYRTRKVPFHDFEGTLPDLTTESGQLVVDKVRHFKTLLLATYYNFYGPDWYYRIFSQGGAGEGDKETFIAAAHKFGLPYYQVKTNLKFDGYNDAKEGFRGIGLYQHDFDQDYKQYQAAKSYVSRNYAKLSQYDPEYSSEKSFEKELMKPSNGKDIDAMFVHVSFYKFDPFVLAKEKRYMRDGKHFRGFGRFELLKGWDLELDTFTLFRDTFCSDNVIEFSYYKPKMSQPEWKDMCNYLSSRVAFLEETHEEAVKPKDKKKD